MSKTDAYSEAASKRVLTTWLSWTKRRSKCAPRHGSNAELLTASRHSFRFLSEWAANRTVELFRDLQLCAFIRNPYVIL